MEKENDVKLPEWIQEEEERVTYFKNNKYREHASYAYVCDYMGQAYICVSFDV